MSNDVPTDLSDFHFKMVSNAIFVGCNGDAIPLQRCSLTRPLTDTWTSPFGKDPSWWVEVMVPGSGFSVNVRFLAGEPQTTERNM